METETMTMSTRLDMMKTTTAERGRGVFNVV
jgi:hypothetical protein